MKARTKQRLQEIEDGHDWVERQPRRDEGYLRVDQCAYCGLTRKYYEDEEEGIEEDSFFAAHSDLSIPLRDVPTSCEE